MDITIGGRPYTNQIKGNQRPNPYCCRSYFIALMSQFAWHIEIEIKEPWISIFNSPIWISYHLLCALPLSFFPSYFLSLYRNNRRIILFFSLFYAQYTRNIYSFSALTGDISLLLFFSYLVIWVIYFDTMCSIETYTHSRVHKRTLTHTWPQINQIEPTWGRIRTYKNSYTQHNTRVVFVIYIQDSVASIKTALWYKQHLGFHTTHCRAKSWSEEKGEGGGSVIFCVWRSHLLDK